MFRALLFSTAFLLSAPALAHTVAQGPNGGLYADAGAHHLELIVEADRVVVFVTDAQDAPVSVAQATGEATVLVGRQVQKVVLAPAEGNRLEGAAAVPEGAAVVVVSVSLPDAKPRARFEITP